MNWIELWAKIQVIGGFITLGCVILIFIFWLLIILTGGTRKR